jgi:hypothetical protein
MIVVILLTVYLHHVIIISTLIIGMLYTNVNSLYLVDY